jgi:hypothetical protein
MYEKQLHNWPEMCDIHGEKEEEERDGKMVVVRE